MKKVALIGVALLATAGFAGKYPVRGHGESVREPEFISIDTTVAAECYADPSLAWSATNRMVAQLEAFFGEHFSADAKYTLEVKPITTYEFSRYIDDGTRKQVCIGTYKGEGHIIFKTAFEKNFGQKIAAIQHFVKHTFGSETKKLSLEEPRNIVNVGSARADVCQETRAVMQQEARERAEQDALRKFDATCSNCNLTPRSLNSIDVDGSSFEVPRYQSERYTAMSADPSFGPSASVTFENIRVSSSALLEFEFDGQLCQTWNLNKKS